MQSRCACSCASTTKSSGAGPPNAITWSPTRRRCAAWCAKNAKLRTERGIGFEDIVFHIERGDLLDILEHPNPDRYTGERIFVVQREDYVYLVPFVEDEHSVFLKTIIPSRKATKQYLGEESNHED